MKKLILLAGVLLASPLLYAQKVFSVEYENQADIKVFVVAYENQADLKVYRVKYENQANGNEGRWFLPLMRTKRKRKYIS